MIRVEVKGHISHSITVGVGRTGTFFVIDTMLERLKNGDQLVDVYGHVSLLRTQRNFMVQTEVSVRQDKLGSSISHNFPIPTIQAFFILLVMSSFTWNT